MRGFSRMDRIWALALAAAVSGFAANALTPAEQKAGWVLLFDGVNLKDHWKMGENGKDADWDPATSWNILDSSLHLVKRPEEHMIFSKDTYTDFEYALDFKMGDQGNSGIFFRVTSPPGWFCSGSEYALLDDPTGGDKEERSKNPADKLPGSGLGAYVKRTGANYDMYPTTKGGVLGGQYYDSTIYQPTPKWNHAEVWANGMFVEHWLNGQKVVDYETGSADWEARFKLSKFYDQCSAYRTTWSKNKSGILGMQGHGNNLEQWFKNLKVRPFTPGEKLNSPLITPNGGSFPGPVTVILDPAIVGSTVRYTLDGSDPTATSPIYKDSLKITASGTIKTRTYRDKFQASDVSTATFTLAGSDIRAYLAKVRPRFSLSLSGKSLVLDNESGKPFDLEVTDVFGRTKIAYATAGLKSELPMRGLQTGVYFVKLRAGEWSAIGKVFLP